MKRSGPLRRKTRLLSKRRQHTPPAGYLERQLWRDDLGPCVLRGVTLCSGKVRGHHIITQAALRSRGLFDRMWDRRNRMALCDRHHGRHHSGIERVPFDHVTAAAQAFAYELGLTYLLERYYPKGAAE